MLILFDLNGFEVLLKNRQEADRAGSNQLDRLLSLGGVAQFFHWVHDPVRAETAPGVPDLGDAFRVEIDDRASALSDAADVAEFARRECLTAHARAVERRKD